MFQRLIDLGTATGAAASIGAAHIFALTNQLPIPTDPGELFKWALRESALLVVILLVLFFYRRDFKNEGRRNTAIISRSIEIQTSLQGTVSRLARAIEDMNRRHRREDPPFVDPEDDDPTTRRRG